MTFQEVLDELVEFQPIDLGRTFYPRLVEECRLIEMVIRKCQVWAADFGLDELDGFIEDDMSWGDSIYQTAWFKVHVNYDEAVGEVALALLRDLPKTKEEATNKEAKRVVLALLLLSIRTGTNEDFETWASWLAAATMTKEEQLKSALDRARHFYDQMKAAETRVEARLAQVAVMENEAREQMARAARIISSLRARGFNIDVDTTPSVKPGWEESERFKLVELEGYVDPEDYY